MRYSLTAVPSPSYLFRQLTAGGVLDSTQMYHPDNGIAIYLSLPARASLHSLPARATTRTFRR